MTNTLHANATRKITYSREGEPLTTSTDEYDKITTRKLDELIGNDVAINACTPVHTNTIMTPADHSLKIEFDMIGWSRTTIEWSWMTL